MSAGPRVLVVDDDREILRAARIRLRSGGYEVLVAEDGSAGLATAKEEVPDAVLLDIRMPGLDGLSVLGALRKHLPTRAIPIVVLSANVAEKAKRRAMELGATYFLEKPYEGVRLLQVVACVLRHRSNADRTR